MIDGLRHVQRDVSIAIPQTTVSAEDVSAETVVWANSTDTSRWTCLSPSIMEACIKCAERQEGECYFFRCGKSCKATVPSSEGRQCIAWKLDGWCAGTRAESYGGGTGMYPFRGQVCKLPEGWRPSTAPPTAAP